MLGGRAQRPVGVAEHGGEFGGGDGADVGADFAVGLAVGAGADEHDAGVGIGGMHGQRGGQAGMNADAADRGLIAKRGLPASFHSSARSPARCTLDAQLPSGLPSPLISPINVGRTASAAKPPIPRRPPAKSPFAANTLAAPRITPTHAFLPSVTFESPQSCPKRGTVDRASRRQSARPSAALRAPRTATAAGITKTLW